MQDVIVFGSEGAKKFSATLNFLNNLAKFGLGKVVETKEGLVFMTRKESKKLEKELAKDNDDVFKIEVVVKYEELLKNKEEAAKLENFENTAKYIVASELVSEYEKTFDSILKDHERQVLEIKQKNEPGNFTEEDLSRLGKLSETKEKINVKAFNKKFNDFNEKNKDIDALEIKTKEAMEEKARIALEKMAQEALEASKKADAEAKRVQEELIKRANADQIAAKKAQIAAIEEEIRILQPENRKFLVPVAIKEKISKFSLGKVNIKSFFEKLFAFPEVPKTVEGIMNAMNNSEYSAVSEEKVIDLLGKDLEKESIESEIENIIEETETIVDQVVEETKVAEQAVVEETKVVEQPVVEETKVVEQPVVEETKVAEQPVIEEEIEVKVTSTEITSPKEYDELDRKRKEFVDENLARELSISTRADKQWIERALYATNNDLDLAKNWLDNRGKISYAKPLADDLPIEKDDEFKRESLENRVKELELANAAKEEQNKELLAKMNEMVESIKHLEKVIIATASINNTVEKDDFEIPFQK
jgi:hypothetical protein